MNEHGEWVRVYKGREQGIPSSIQQAQRQAEFLKRFLNLHAPQLAGKMLGVVQAYFGAMTIDVIVAISDTGIIDRPGTLLLTEVCKADQAPGKIDEILARQLRETSLLNFTMKDGRPLARSELENILAFLPTAHRPLMRSTETKVMVSSEAREGEPVAEPVSAVDADKVCAMCGKPLPEKVVQFCRERAEVFGGRIYCFDHQRTGRMKTKTATGGGS